MATAARSADAESSAEASAAAEAVAQAQVRRNLGTVLVANRRQHRHRHRHRQHQSGWLDDGTTTTDNDNADFTTAETGAGTTVSESGTTDTFTVVLDSQPVADVTVDRSEPHALINPEIIEKDGVTVTEEGDGLTTTEKATLGIYAGTWRGVIVDEGGVTTYFVARKERSVIRVEIQSINLQAADIRRLVSAQLVELEGYKP